MGFLHATVKDQKQTRMDEWSEAGVEDFDLPDLDADQEYLVGLFFDLGPTRNNGMGDGPTDWDILMPYATAKALDSDDTAILADMCKGYYRAREAGTNPLAIAPVDQG